MNITRTKQGYRKLGLYRWHSTGRSRVYGAGGRVQAGGGYKLVTSVAETCSEPILSCKVASKVSFASLAFVANFGKRSF